MSRNLYARTHEKFTRINEIETIYERPRVNVKLSARGSTFTFTRDLPYIVISYARKVYVRTHVKITRH